MGTQVELKNLPKLKDLEEVKEDHSLAATNTGDEVKSKEPSESTSSRKDCHCEGYSTVGGSSPSLLRELFYPPAPRRVGYSIRYNPYCTIFCQKKTTTNILFSA